MCAAFCVYRAVLLQRLEGGSDVDAPVRSTPPAGAGRLSGTALRHWTLSSWQLHMGSYCFPLLPSGPARKLSLVQAVVGKPESST